MAHVEILVIHLLNFFSTIFAPKATKVLRVLEEPSVWLLLLLSHDMWQAGKHFQARRLQMSFLMHKHKSLHCSRSLLNDWNGHQIADDFSTTKQISVQN